MDINIWKQEGNQTFNRFGEEIIECTLCGGRTTMKGTRRCDSCYELESRIQRNPDLARKILAQITA